jgi:hypothetical protein
VVFSASGVYTGRDRSTPYNERTVSRPTAERTAADRYREPTLLALMALPDARPLSGFAEASGALGLIRSAFLSIKKPAPAAS